jgi:hypothetical protein
MSRVTKSEYDLLVESAREHLGKTIELPAKNRFGKVSQTQKVRYEFTKIEEVGNAVFTAEDGAEPRTNMPNGILTAEDSSKRKESLAAIVRFFEG